MRFLSFSVVCVFGTFFKGAGRYIDPCCFYPPFFIVQKAIKYHSTILGVEKPVDHFNRMRYLVCRSLYGRWKRIFI